MSVVLSGRLRERTIVAAQSIRRCERSSWSAIAVVM